MPEKKKSTVRKVADGVKDAASSVAHAIQEHVVKPVGEGLGLSSDDKKDERSAGGTTAPPAKQPAAKHSAAARMMVRSVPGKTPTTGKGKAAGRGRDPALAEASLRGRQQGAAARSQQGTVTGTNPTAGSPVTPGNQMPGGTYLYRCDRCPLIIEVGGGVAWRADGTVYLEHLWVACGACGTMHRLTEQAGVCRVLAFPGPVRGMRAVTVPDGFGETSRRRSWRSRATRGTSANCPAGSRPWAGWRAATAGRSGGW